MLLETNKMRRDRAQSLFAIPLKECYILTKTQGFDDDVHEDRNTYPQEN